MTVAATTTTQRDDVSLKMLSPPLSPYPDLASLVNSYRKRQYNDDTFAHAAYSTPSSSDSASPAPATHRPTPATSAASNDSFLNPSSTGKRMITCWDSLITDPVQYYKRERAFLDLYPVHKPTWSRYIYVDSPTETRARRRPRTIRRVASDVESSDSVVTRSRAASLPPADRASSDRSSDEEHLSTPRRSPAKKRPSAGSPVRVHDLNITQIEDYSPSISLLPPGRSLRAEWKGAPMDLSNDPDVHLLHPAEAHLASVLRLPADVYLDSKRRLFAEKVHRLRQGLAFRRTDSQKACRIDVNKASRLFGAFEKVGWLNDDLFSQYL